MSQSLIIELLRKGEHDEALDELYRNFPAFKNSFIKSGGNKLDAEDIFQDALLILIEKVTDRDFILTCNVNSYLFSICRNLTLEHFRKKGKEVKLQLEKIDDSCDAETINTFLEKENMALGKNLVKWLYHKPAEYHPSLYVIATT